MSDYNGNLWDDGNDVLNAALGASSAISGLASSVGQYKSQKEYNETQKEIAREQNALTQQENELSRNFELRKLLLQQEYASELSQRRRLEQAGVNPYSMYGTSLGSPSTGSPTINPYQRPDQVVEDALAKGLRDTTNDTIENISILAKAKKDDADARNQQIQNMFAAPKALGQLERMGVDNQQAWTDLRQAVEMNPKLQENLVAQTINLDEQSALLRVQAGLARYDLNFLRPEQLKQVQEETKLFVEKQLTEQEYREHMKRMDENGALSAYASWVCATTGQYLAPSQRAYFESQSRNIDEDTVSKTLYNSVYRVYGASTADAMLNLYNKQGWLSEQQARDILSKNGKGGDVTGVIAGLIGTLLGRGVSSAKHITGFGR